MNRNSYKFKIGKFDCLVISDGTLTVPPPPSEIPSEPTSAAKGEDMNVLSLYIDTGVHRVLIDTGCGGKFVGTDTGKLVKHLEEAGIRRQDIDIIVFTHGHMDHTAGTFDKNGKAIFPNARYIVSKKEWQCWVDKKERLELRELFTVARQELLPIPDQFQLAEEGQEIVPGIRLFCVPGHTPGSSILQISSQGERMTCVGDLIHSAIEFGKPDYYDFLDVDSAQAIKSRTEVLTRLAQSGEMALVCHFPFPGLGYLVEEEGGLGWKGIEF